MRANLFKIAAVVMALCVTAVAHAATIDVTRIDGVAQIPTVEGVLRMEMDIRADAQACDAIAGSLHEYFQAQEMAEAERLGLSSDYVAKTNIFCDHRLVTVPVTVVDSPVCEFEVTPSSTFEDVLAACPLLDQ